MLVLLAGCGSKKEPPGPSRQPEGTRPTAEGEPPPGPSEPVRADFPEGTRSLELTRTVPVRLEAGDDAKRIGTIAIDTRVRWKRTAAAKGCTKPWVEIEPRGWVCGDNVKASTKPAF